MARQTAERITTQFGAALDRSARQRVSRAFERMLVPRENRRRGMKRTAMITTAYEDWKAGLRGQSLYQKHIPGCSAMSQYRREYA